MSQILPLEADNHETAEMQAAIERWLTQMAELRAQMQRHDAAIEETSAETRAVLTEIGEILTDLKAA